jgi:hypothetical protein
MPVHRPRVVAFASFLFLSCWAAAAGAQQVSSQGPLVLEPLHSDFLFAPDLKVTKVNGSIGTLAGGYAGVVKDDHLFVGGGAYWLTDRKSDSRNLAYGGLIVGWFFNPDRPVSFSAKTLVGFGQFSEPIALQILPDPLFHADKDGDKNNTTAPLPGVNTHFRIRSNFLVFEPQAEVHVRLSRMARLTGGIGYRAADEPRGFDGLIRGATGSVSVQFTLGNK